MIITYWCLESICVLRMISRDFTLILSFSQIVNIRVHCRLALTMKFLCHSTPKHASVSLEISRKYRLKHERTNTKIMCCHWLMIWKIWVTCSIMHTLILRETNKWSRRSERLRSQYLRRDRLPLARALARAWTDISHHHESTSLSRVVHRPQPQLPPKEPCWIWLRPVH